MPFALSLPKGVRASTSSARTGGRHAVRPEPAEGGSCFDKLSANGRPPFEKARLFFTFYKGMKNACAP